MPKIPIHQLNDDKNVVRLKYNTQTQLIDQISKRSTARGTQRALGLSQNLTLSNAGEMSTARSGALQPMLAERRNLKFHSANRDIMIEN